MYAYKVMLLVHPIVTEGWIKKHHYAPIRIQCVNALGNTDNEFSIIHIVP